MSPIRVAEEVERETGARKVSRRSPVFLLAPARSFSTVSLALLAGHPGLFGFPELLLFSAPDVRGFLDEGSRLTRYPDSWIRSRLNGVLRAIAVVHEDSQSAEALGRAENWLRARPDWTMVGLMDYLLARVDPLTGVEKSPDTVGSVDTLGNCVASFPNARFIHLTRHPVTTQRSMHEHYRPVSQLSDASLAVACATQWYLAHLRVAKTLADLPADRWMRVRGEDLLSEPRVWLPRICAWLGLDCDEDIVERMLHTERWRFAQGDPARWRAGGGDPKFLRSPRLRAVPPPGPVEFDPAWGPSAEMADRMKTLASALGYGERRPEERQR
jgi:hypothetical protein